MRTSIEFKINTDNPEFRAQLESIQDDPVLYWRMAVMACQMQLEKALKREAVHNYTAAIAARARATRKANRERLRIDHD